MGSRIEIIAFVIALAAFIIALLQVIQQYWATSTVRSKVGRAAIGMWAETNRRGWNRAELKVKVEYRNPTLGWEDVVRCLRAQKMEKLLRLRRLPEKYRKSEFSSIRVTPRGMEFARLPQLNLTGGNDPEEGKTEASPRSLSWRDRRALAEYYKFSLDSDAPRQFPCTATWADMMTALVGNPLHLVRYTASGLNPGPVSYFDADTIPSALDNPTMHIHFSDLISCGAALDMEVRSIDLHLPALHMTGQYCSIASQEHSGVGVIAQYTCKPNHVHHLQTCMSEEINALVEVARGYLHIGDFLAHMTDWGYYSVDAVFEISLARATTDSWCEIKVKEAFSPRCEGDAHVQWDGRWSQPQTTRVGFLLTHAGNPAVANSFPHSLVKDWPESERQIASQRACRLVNHGVGFIESPVDFCERLHANDTVMNHYKLANNWGAEHGGVRGWSMGASSEFVKRASECWIVDGQMQEVPVLRELRRLLEQGEFGRNWGKAFRPKLFLQDESGWKPNAETLCWIQIMMLDTWIARRVDLMILGKSEEASIPVDSMTAQFCALFASEAENGMGSTTGWKKSRSLFIRHYLARLAEGIIQDDGSRVGVSCMSSGGGIGEEGWEGMPVGAANDWMILDAVLSLRAVLLGTRLELMYNTDVFLELRQFDPMIRMA